MGGSPRRWITVLAAMGVVAVSAGGPASRPAAGAGPASRPAATNLQLLMGVDADFPPRDGERALSASPVFAVTGGPLELDVSRSGGVVSVRQDGVILPVHPKSVVQGFPRYFEWKLVRADGSVAASAVVDACPMPGTVFSLTAWGFLGPVNLDPANPDTPAVFPYPQECGDPLATRARWGFPSGWGVQMHIQVPDATPPGSYVLEATVNPGGAIRESTRADDHIRMPVEVLDLTAGLRAGQVAAGRAGTATPSPVGAGASAAVTRAGGQADLPDLVPLPSENIAARHQENGDFLRFNSTVANLGRGPLRLAGFRSDMTSPQMAAYQLLFHGGAEVSRRSAGTLVYDPEHLHWHFDHLADYRLVDAEGTAVASSGKIGFCMADVHQIDASLPGFATPDFVGFGDCGSFPSRSVQEALDVGWGDEYDQVRPGQELDISSVPNGTYRIQITADPEHKLLETTRDNNVSYRTVVIGGVPGARTVTAPPVDGVDTEAAWAALHLPF